jgi:hypothetical protein
MGELAQMFMPGHAVDPAKVKAGRDALIAIHKTEPPISDLDNKLKAILTDDQKKALQNALDKQNADAGGVL